MGGKPPFGVSTFPSPLLTGVDGNEGGIPIVLWAATPRRVSFLQSPSCESWDRLVSRFPSRVFRWQGGLAHKPAPLKGAGT
jgi:hypothetical protein